MVSQLPMVSQIPMVSLVCFGDASVFPIKPGFHMIVLIVQVISKISRQPGRLRQFSAGFHTIVSIASKTRGCQGSSWVQQQSFGGIFANKMTASIAKGISWLVIFVFFRFFAVEYLSKTPIWGLTCISEAGEELGAYHVLVQQRPSRISFLVLPRHSFV